MVDKKLYSTSALNLMLKFQLIFLHVFFSFSTNASSITKSSEPIIVEEESSQEAHETSVSTEIYDGESLEVSVEDTKFIEKPQMEIASRIIWTTPKSVIAETKKATTAKETVTAAMDMIPSTESGIKDWDVEISEYKKESTRLSNIFDSYNKSGEFIS